MKQWKFQSYHHCILSLGARPGWLISFKLANSLKTIFQHCMTMYSLNLLIEERDGLFTCTKICLLKLLVDLEKIFMKDYLRISYKTRNQPKPAKTSQNHPQSTKTTHNQPKPTTTSQNYPKPAELSKNHPNKRWFCAVVHLQQKFQKTSVIESVL